MMNAYKSISILERWKPTRGPYDLSFVSLGVRRSKGLVGLLPSGPSESISGSTTLDARVGDPRARAMLAVTSTILRVAILRSLCRRLSLSLFELAEFPIEKTQRVDVKI